MWTSTGSKRGTKGKTLGRFVAGIREQRSVLDPLQGDVSDDQPRDQWRGVIRRRVMVFVALFTLWTVGIQARLLYIQVYMHETYLEMATSQQESLIRPAALRGDIVARDGALFAYSVDADSLVADPSLVGKPHNTAAAICAALGDCTPKERQDIIRKLSSKSRFALLRRSRLVSPEQARRITERKLPGILLQTDTRRFYPGGELAAHVVGFVDQDNNGQGGVEQKYDDLMRGIPGVARAQVDAHRQRLETRVEREPVPGGTLELTIDSNLQYIAERELRAGVEATNAVGGTVIVMEPMTGEILALANYPTYNPNIVGRVKPELLSNRATQMPYEPGSTFKLVTASAAIEEKIIGAYDLVDTNPGRISFPGRKAITEASGHNYGVLTFEDVIVKSSNVGAIKVGLRTGADRLTRYVRRFGFGQVLAPDFIGQTRGIWNPANLNDSGLASVSMGYQIGVTPLQMATAASAIANGGLLMEPHVVRATIKEGRRTPVAPKVLRRVITPETAAVVRVMMEAVVERGTGKSSQVTGYHAAAKTGTAHKAVSGGYSDTDYNASFVGFLPSRQPKYVILVVVDTPRKGSYYGGVAAGPIFRRIGEAAMQYAGVPTSINPEPPVVVRAGLTTLPPQPVRVPALLPASLQVGGPALMPDVTGLSARDALRVLGAAGMSVHLSGTGFTTHQKPAAGTAIEPGDRASLVLERRAPLSSTSAVRVSLTTSSGEESHR